MDSTDTLQLKLPGRSLGALSFCSSEPGQLARWLTELPVSDHQQNGATLANALDELARLDRPPNELYQHIEAIRSPARETASSLYQRYLKRYITFESGQQTWFDLCHRLHSGLATAYKAVVQCCLDNGEHGEVLAAALHRAVSESASAYLFHCLLYHPTPERLWLELHTLYQLVVKHSHQNFRLEDPCDSKCKPISAENHYKRVLLLSRSDTHKLSPDEIQQVWQILSAWINHCKIQPKSGLKTYFSVNLNRDEGLQYAVPEPDKIRSGMIGLDVRILTAHLDKIKQEPKVAKVLSARLIEHLTLSWRQIQKRSSPRRAGAEVSLNTCETCFGFTGIHYHLSGQRKFDDIIAAHSSSGKGGLLEQADDVWSQAHDAEIREEEESSDDPLGVEKISFNREDFLANERLSALPAEIINTSHTGFCLKINGKLPQQFHGGELIGIRQEPESPWALYTVRWLGVSAANEVTFGVNLIAESVEAAAVSLIHKTGEVTYYQRSLLLRDPQGTSLIMPNFSAKEGTKFELIHNDDLQKGQLMKCIYTTPVWCQYQFKLFG